MTVHVSVDPSTQQTSVLFSLGDDAPSGEVSVVGSFNGSTAGVDTLRPHDDGARSVSITVPPGQDVHFRYLAENGVWFDEPDAAEVTPVGSAPHLDATTGGQLDGQHSRAHLLPEEPVAGSDDPQAQAEAIMADSEARVQEQAVDVAGASAQTRPRTSAQATDPL